MSLHTVSHYPGRGFLDIYRLLTLLGAWDTGTKELRTEWAKGSRNWGGPGVFWQQNSRKADTGKEERVKS